MNKKYYWGTALIGYALVMIPAGFVSCAQSANSSKSTVATPAAQLPSAQQGAVSSMSAPIQGTIQSGPSALQPINQPFAMSITEVSAGSNQYFQINFNSSGQQNLSFSRLASFQLGNTDGSPQESAIEFNTSMDTLGSNGQLIPSPLQFPSIANDDEIMLVFVMALSGNGNKLTFDPSQSAIYIADCGSSSSTQCSIDSEYTLTIQQ